MTTLTALRDATDIAAHGGKAVQLARLITAGLPIPEGFVIPRDLAPRHLRPAADTLLAWAAHARTPYGLIVGSSSPVEDGPQASFVGLYASRFTVTEAPALLDAITLVRNSGARAAVRAYADAHRIPVSNQIAAIIQPAIRPYCAGVLTGQLREDTWATWQIEAVHGLAGPLVSGHVSGELHHPGQSPTPAAQTDMVLPARPTELRLPPGEWITVDDHEGRAGRAKIRTSAGGLVTVLRPPAWTTRPILSPTDRDRLLDLAATSAAVTGLREHRPRRRARSSSTTSRDRRHHRRTTLARRDRRPRTRHPLRHRPPQTPAHPPRRHTPDGGRDHRNRPHRHRHPSRPRSAAHHRRCRSPDLA